MSHHQKKSSIVRLLTLGDSHVGKSSILMQYTQNEFNIEYLPTIGIDFRLKTLIHNGQTLKLQIWDTAGQERFRTITHNYYRGAQGILLVYDVTNRESFNNIRKWINDIESYADPQVKIILIGNKSDHKHRSVSQEEGQELAQDLSIPFIEVSSQSGNNIDQAFEIMIETLFSHKTSLPVPSSISIKGHKLVIQSSQGEEHIPCTIM